MISLSFVSFLPSYTFRKQIFRERETRTILFFLFVKIHGGGLCLRGDGKVKWNDVEVECKERGVSSERPDAAMTIFRSFVEDARVKFWLLGRESSRGFPAGEGREVRRGKSRNRRPTRSSRSPGG